MLALGDPENRHALGVAAHDADVRDGRADHLALVGDQHQLFALARGEGGNDTAIALGGVDVGDALSAAIGAPVFIGGRALPIPVLGQGQDELLILLQLGIALFGECAFDILPLTPWRALEIGFPFLLGCADAVQDRHGNHFIVADEADAADTRGGA